MNDLDVEVELYTEEEGEKHAITSPAIVYVPARLVHCPWNFAKANKPVFLFYVTDDSVEM